MKKTDRDNIPWNLLRSMIKYWWPAKGKGCECCWWWCCCFYWYCWCLTAGACVPQWGGADNLNIDDLQRVTGVSGAHITVLDEYSSIKKSERWVEWMSARQQVNDLFTVAMIYLDMHEDAHRVQCGTRQLKMHGSCIIPLVRWYGAILNCLLVQLTQLTPFLY